LVERDLLGVVIRLDAGDLLHIAVVPQAVVVAAFLAERRELQPGQLVLRFRGRLRYQDTQLGERQRLAIVVVAVLAFLIISPGFRKVVGVLVFGIACAIALFVMNKSDGPTRQAKAPVVDGEPIVINTSDLALSAITVVRPSYDANGVLDEWILQGVVTNNSKHALLGMKFEVVVLDCPRSANTNTTNTASKCRTIGQQRSDASINVPAGQTRAFSTFAIKFDGMPPADQRYERKFNWKTVELSADQWEGVPGWRPPGE
jgi:hypothetical protein